MLLPLDLPIVSVASLGTHFPLPTPGYLSAVGNTPRYWFVLPPPLPQADLLTTTSHFSDIRALWLSV